MPQTKFYDWRQSHGRFSQRVLAQESGLPEKYISEISQGWRLPTKSQARAIAAALGTMGYGEVKMTELFTEVTEDE